MTAFEETPTAAASHCRDRPQYRYGYLGGYRGPRYPAGIAARFSQVMWLRYCLE